MAAPNASFVREDTTEPESDSDSDSDADAESSDEIFVPKPTAEKLRKKKKPFGNKYYNLVDLKDTTKESIDKVEADVNKLSRKLDNTIEKFRNEFQGLQVDKYYIGKTYISLQGPEDSEEYRTTHDKWTIKRRESGGKDEGITSRKSTHKKERYGNVGLVVLAIVTEEVLPEGIARSVKVEDYALILEQRLQHKKLLGDADDRCANVSSSEGKKVSDENKKNAYVIYVTIGCDNWQNYLDRIKNTPNK